MPHRRRILGWMPVLLAAVLPCGAQTALERGAEALRKGAFAAAETALLEAVRERPSSAPAHKLLGMVYSAQERHLPAEPHFREACRLDPRDEDTCYYLGRLYYTLNRFEESRQALEIAVRHATRNRGRVLLGMALTLEALGQSAPAERSYKEAVQTGYRQARIDYGLFLFRHGRASESIGHLRQAGATAELERVKRALDNAPASQAAGREPVRVRFEASPLDMVVRNGAAGDKHQVETMPAGVAVFDYDNDGWPDIYVANGASVPPLEKTGAAYQNRLFRNQRDGTFADVTAGAGVAGQGYSMGVAAGDYDNDGWVDLFVTGVRANTLYRNRGDGTFEDATGAAGLVSDGRWSIAAGWFDYDNDGLLDLFVVRYCVWNPATEPYCGLPKPGYRTYCHPQFYEPLPNALYHNQGQGRFRDVSRESGVAGRLNKGMGVAFGDYDGDGRLDVFVANDTVPNLLFQNQGGGKFRESALAAGAAYSGDGAALSWMGADFRDYDNDGREDLFVTNLTNERFSLFRNTGRGQFADLSGPSGLAVLSLPWSGWSNGIFDFNNDGFKDLFAAGGNVNDNAELTTSRASRQPNLVFLNRGNGTFALELLPGEALHRGAAFGDFDRDGRMDAVVTRLNEAPLVLHNTTPGAGHWLQLRLAGTRGNRDGIGARMRVVTASGEQWNRVTTSVGYAGSSDRTVHFGLGKDTRVDVVEIEWPSGVRQILRNLPAGRYVTIEEPEK
ncbi:MAG: VCBS repeat-containing protein [Acidobacteria bacterium]|nr:VCBS repeat-containing protein [Acidobacteriota bacterium]